jgi:hypothetical protein
MQKNKTSQDSRCDDRYAGERYNPSLAHCTSLALRFDGNKLVMTASNEVYSYPAVSGRPYTKGQFNYRVSNQMSPNGGPIPEGIYWINPDELWERGWLKSVFLPESHERGWGDFRVTIHPFTTTETYCRGGFFIHGGTDPGSAGCIDLTSQLADMGRRLKRKRRVDQRLNFYRVQSTWLHQKQ